DLPSSVTAAAAPTSPRCSKFSANASLTRLNFGSQVPSIFTAMICLLIARGVRTARPRHSTQAKANHLRGGRQGLTPCTQWLIPKICAAHLFEKLIFQTGREQNT